MNDGNPSGSGRAVDLSRLNSAEKGMLQLLAQGHTAKSIANALGSTPAAVNERFREARRKTGVGSSRELARLLNAQESRDKQFGVAVSPRFISQDSKPAANVRWLRKGVLAMFALTVITAAAAVAFLAQQPAVLNETDPLFGVIPSTANGPDQLHARLRTEQRDEKWASAAERLLRARYSRIQFIGGSNNILRVTCGSSICEVAGTINAPTSKDDEDNLRTPLNRTMRALQDKTLFDELSKSGLKMQSGTFVESTEKPPRPMFLTYLQLERAKAK